VRFSFLTIHYYLKKVIMRLKFYTRMGMAFATMLMFTFALTAQTTIQVSCPDGTYDEEEMKAVVESGTVGDCDLTSSDLELAFDHEPSWVGMIFPGVQIPPGSNVTNAYVQFTVNAIEPGTTDATLNLEVYGAAEANVSGPFTGTAFEVSSHPATTAKVTGWSPPPSVNVGDAGPGEQTPDLSAIINEIIGLEGWAAGNGIMIVVTTDATLTEDINREMEASPPDGAVAPVLNVTFTEGTGIEANKEFTYSVYPNPTEGQVYISNPSNEDFSYEIFNINGQLVASRYNLSGSSVELDMSAFAKGMYFVDVTSSERVETHKLILK
jgi:Secretion system C-terminal sorting domain